MMRQYELVERVQSYNPQTDEALACEAKGGVGFQRRIGARIQPAVKLARGRPGCSKVQKFARNFLG